MLMCALKSFLIKINIVLCVISSHTGALSQIFCLNYNYWEINCFSLLLTGSVKRYLRKSLELNVSTPK